MGMYPMPIFIMPVHGERDSCGGIRAMSLGISLMGPLNSLWAKRVVMVPSDLVKSKVLSWRFITRDATLVAVTPSPCIIPGGKSLMHEVCNVVRTK